MVTVPGIWAPLLDHVVAEVVLDEASLTISCPVSEELHVTPGGRMTAFPLASVRMKVTLGPLSCIDADGGEI